MRPINPFWDYPLFDLFETRFPDFLLAFTFFTALAFAVLSRRFGNKRPAAAMSAALGMALAIGLVWWERDHGWSVRDLGPVALVLAVVLLAVAIFYAVRQIGGFPAGIGIGLGTSIIIAWIQGLQWPINTEIVQIAAIVALVIGILSFLMHLQERTRFPFYPSHLRAEKAGFHHDLKDLHRDRRIGKSLKRNLKHVRHEADFLTKNPRERTDVMLQLRRILPAEGWLTQQLGRLRKRAQIVRKGHLTRIDEINHVIANMPPNARKRASSELSSRYQELHLDERLERLDRKVSENEERIRELTKRAQDTLAKYDYRSVGGLLKEAEGLQSQNSKLLKEIIRTEEKLSRIAKQISKDAR